MQPTRRRILYAEDHQDTREFVCLLLGRSDYEVIETESGQVALNRAQHEHFDLFLLDTMLPDVSGIELCQKIREFDASTPILFFSGVAYEAEKQKALGCGAQGYLIKPDGMGALTETISRLLKGAEAVVN